MAEHFEEVTVELTNDKVQFTGVSPSNPDRPIAFDYKPPIGDGQGYNGLELLLMSFAGCTGTAVAFLLRKMGKTVSGLRVHAKGLRRDQPPIKFEKISLEFIVDSTDAQDEEIQRAIRLAEESVGPVWQMIKNNVEVTAQHRINAA
ncbi:MAG: OsmC family protein [Deltaproteobacteria bacterium]|nr:OsmC family protein [Deltaproteobacteria bacterium]